MDHLTEQDLERLLAEGPVIPEVPISIEGAMLESWRQDEGTFYKSRGLWKAKASKARSMLEGYNLGEAPLTIALRHKVRQQSDYIQTSIAAADLGRKLFLDRLQRENKTEPSKLVQIRTETRMYNYKLKIENQAIWGEGQRYLEATKDLSAIARPGQGPEASGASTSATRDVTDESRAHKEDASNQPDRQSLQTSYKENDYFASQQKVFNSSRS